MRSRRSDNPASPRHRLEENAAAVALKISADTEDALLQCSRRAPQAGCAKRGRRAGHGHPL